MNTSYFAKSAKHPNAVAICAKVPDWFKGRQYKKLAPSWDIFNEWKKTGDNALYVRRFNLEILFELDPVQVIQDLGKDAVLLCYESPGKFCHRHEVAKWITMCAVTMPHHFDKPIYVTEL
jgi:hypothetical protein